MELLSSLQQDIRRLRAESEKSLKEQRKHNVILRELRLTSTSRADQEREVELFVKEKFQLTGEIIRVQLLPTRPPRFRVYFADLATKILVMKSKQEKLKESGVFMDNDLTPLEAEVQFRLRQIAREKKTEGKQVRVAHQKLLIDGTWHTWDGQNNTLVPVERKPKLKTNSATQKKN